MNNLTETKRPLWLTLLALFAVLFALWFNFIAGVAYAVASIALKGT